MVNSRYVILIKQRLMLKRFSFMVIALDFDRHPKNKFFFLLLVGFVALVNKFGTKQFLSIVTEADA